MIISSVLHHISRNSESVEKLFVYEVFLLLMRNYFIKMNRTGSNNRRGGNASGGSSGSTCSPVKCFFYLVTALACFFILLILPHSPLNILTQMPAAPPLAHQIIPVTRTDESSSSTSTTPSSNLRSVDTVKQSVRDPEPADVTTPVVIDNKPITPVTNTIPPKMKPKIAVAITVTKDGPFVDGALVLGYAAKKYHSAKHGYPSAYDIELVAFVTKKVVTTRTILSQFGWRILERDLPVALEEIENKDYMERMRDSGCCGADEFLKLWAYTLTEYHRVMHLDMDSIIFRNLDSLFNIDKELLYTGDYNMKAGSPVAPAQGGFLVIRPSLERFEEYRAIIRKGDHRSGSGWGGTHIGNFWGGQTIQGIVPYFYHSIHPGDAMEMNRCQYNNMVDNPYHKNTLRCINGEETCEDCRASNPDEVYSAHFTICQKPWTCTAHDNPRNKVVCLAFHKKWFQLRDEMEKELGIDPLSYRPEKYIFKESLGMCKAYGDSKYYPMPIDKVTKQPDF